jgi:GAF domain-containing protein
LLALSPLSVDDRTDDPRLGMIRSLVADSRLSSMVFVPLLVDGDVSGGLGLGLAEDRSLVQEDHDLVQSVADQLSGVLSRAHLAQEHRRWMTAIGQLSEDE